MAFGCPWPLPAQAFILPKQPPHDPREWNKSSFPPLTLTPHPPPHTHSQPQPPTTHMSRPSSASGGRHAAAAASSTTTTTTAGNASTSLQLLQFVSDLRQSTDAASQQLGEALAANESLAAELEKEKKEERRLLKDMEATLHQTREAVAKAQGMQATLQELETRQGTLALRATTARALEGEAAKFLADFKARLGTTLAKHQTELQAEVGKAQELHGQLEEARKGLGVAEAGVQAVQEERAAGHARLAELVQQREGLAKELRAEQEEMRRLQTEVLPKLQQETTDTEDALAELETYTQALKNERLRTSISS